MKIGIITFHAAFNYGSMLQAYALQTYLSRQGHDVEIINYRSHYQKSIYYKPFDIHSKYSILSSFKRLLLYPSSLCRLKTKWELFNSFLNQNLKITKEYNTIHELERVPWDYDLLITGSDQIWNTGAPDSGEAYFGNFINNANTKKIAYAPSLGQYPENVDTKFLKAQIRNFTALSVREEKAKYLLIKYGIAKDISVVCDPTLLLDVQAYERLYREEPLIQGKYIFFYTPVGLPLDYFKIVNDFAETLGMPVITERAYYPKDIKKYKHIMNYPEVGPSEFLNLIKNATYVCGGSFHLQVFSILFRKEFYCINGDKDSRTHNLLVKLGLEDRIVSLSHPTIVTSHPTINYDNISNKLTYYREPSFDFLNKYTVK